MTPKDFVKCFAEEKQSLLAAYLSNTPETAVSKRISSLNLSSEQKKEMNKIVDDILTDAFYTILLGLDGCTQIGGKQIEYRLMDEEGNELTGKGEIESQAWEQFQENTKKPN